jgi:hypothetical protein
MVAPDGADILNGLFRPFFFDRPVQSYLAARQIGRGSVAATPPDQTMPIIG